MSFKIITKNYYNFSDINNNTYNSDLSIKALKAVGILESVKQKEVMLYKRFINKNIDRNSRIN